MVLSVERAGIVVCAVAHRHEFVLVARQVDVGCQLGVDVGVALVHLGGKPDEFLGCAYLVEAVHEVCQVGVGRAADGAEAVHELVLVDGCGVFRLVGIGWLGLNLQEQTFLVNHSSHVATAIEVTD